MFKENNLKIYIWDENKKIILEDKNVYHLGNDDKDGDPNPDDYGHLFLE